MANLYSFCTTCMGRTHHLKQTLPENISRVQAHFPHPAEFVLLDYNSPDDMAEWVHAHLQQELETGLVKYYKTPYPQYFHMAHAKNLSHRLSTGNVLINLDADSYLSILYLQALARLKPNEILLGSPPLWSNDLYKGMTGRIALYRQPFYWLRGYDEYLNTSYGYDDLDLGRRGLGAGLRHIGFCLSMMGQLIPHDDLERMRHYAETTTDAEEAKRLKYNRQEEAGRRSFDNMQNRRWRANFGHSWGNMQPPPQPPL